MAIRKYKKLIIKLISLLIPILLFSCDWGIIEVDAEITGTPDRIIYVASVDTEIDLSGLKILWVQRNGDFSETPLEDWIKHEQEPSRIVSDVDFAHAGVYEVEIYYEWRYSEFLFERDKVLSYKFFIQVIDEETIDGLIDNLRGQ